MCFTVTTSQAVRAGRQRRGRSIPLLRRHPRTGLQKFAVIEEPALGRRSLHGRLAGWGTSKFSWCRRLLAGPAVRANNSDLRAVRHAELAHDLPNMKFDGTFTHRQPARNDLVRIATAQKFDDRSLPRC